MSAVPGCICADPEWGHLCDAHDPPPSVAPPRPPRALYEDPDRPGVSIFGVVLDSEGIRCAGCGSLSAQPGGLCVPCSRAWE